MKKWLIAVAALFIILVISIYIFIPSELTVSTVSAAKCTSTGAVRILSDTDGWKKWWPGNENLQGKKLVYKNNSYTVSEFVINGFKINIGGNGGTVESRLNLIPISYDSTLIQWQWKLSTSTNPITRVTQYQNAVAIKNSMDDILANLRRFLDVPKNIYGITITQTSTKDTALIATKRTFSFYPADSNIYGMINELKKYFASQKLLVTGDPMMNVTDLGNGKFEAMVALPTNKEVRPQGDFFFRSMVRGNFLTTEVTGGNAAVAHAAKEMQYYIDDYKRSAMAIPFQSLMVDRSVETDSSLWITKLYFPVE